MVVVFSLLLIIGVALGQIADLSLYQDLIGFITGICLAYIMMDIGMEFSVDKRKLSSYGLDVFVAFSAAIFPAILWLLYFTFVFRLSLDQAFVYGLSCAPTSAGVLFSMLLAAGLQKTWVFGKARVLAVLDDLVTILLLLPLEILFAGFHLRPVLQVGIITAFLFASFKWQNAIRWPTQRLWILFYSIVLVSLLVLIQRVTHLHLEILIPAFMWGCLLHAEHHKQDKALFLDPLIKGMFMVLVGFSFPKVNMQQFPLIQTLGHVFMLTLLANLGKTMCFAFYRQEASVKERMALSVAMFPRGEVGAAVLLIAIKHSQHEYVQSLIVITLALNLILTGGFIRIIFALLNKSKTSA